MMEHFGYFLLNSTQLLSSSALGSRPKAILNASVTICVGSLNDWTLRLLPMGMVKLLPIGIVNGVTCVKGVTCVNAAPVLPISGVTLAKGEVLFRPDINFWISSRDSVWDIWPT